MFKFIKLYFREKKEELIFKYRLYTMGNSFINGMNNAINSEDIQKTINKLFDSLGIKNE